MRHSKKSVGAAASVAALMILSGTAAMASRLPEDEDPVLLCHKTGNGYQLMEVNANAEQAHRDHGDVDPVDGQCPASEEPPTEEPPAQASSCTADQTNDSHNTTGDTVQQGGLINIGGIALQGTNLGLLNNVLCMGNVGNGLLANVLGTVLGGGGSSSESADSPDCSADQNNTSTNTMGGGLIAGLININGIGLQGNNIGALNNLLCGGNVLNDLTAAVLGTVGLF